jgi:hypothetical protein
MSVHAQLNHIFMSMGGPQAHGKLKTLPLGSMSVNP